jgi:hypothetical protein
MHQTDDEGSFGLILKMEMGRVVPGDFSLGVGPAANKAPKRFPHLAFDAENISAGHRDGK